MATASSLGQVLSAEIVVGIGFALSIGADTGLFTAVCKQHGFDSKKELALTRALMPLLLAVGALGIAPVAAFNARLAVVLVALPFAVGGIVAAFIQEEGVHREVDDNPGGSSRVTVAVKDMRQVVTAALIQNKQLRWTLLAGGSVWCIVNSLQGMFTPIFTQAGISLEATGIGWLIFYFFITVGGLLCRQVMGKWSIKWLFALPVITALVVVSVMTMRLNMWTLGIFSLGAIAQGWCGAPYVRYRQ